jgi:hypothetical protein
MNAHAHSSIPTDSRKTQSPSDIYIYIYIYIYCILHTDELRYQLSEAEKNFAKRWRPPGNAKWGEGGAKVVTVMQNCTESLHIRPVPVNLRPASIA